MTNTNTETLGTTEQQREAELSLYDQLAQKVAAGLGEVKSAVDPDTLMGLIDKAAGEIKDAGGASLDAVTGATNRLKKDLASSADRLVPIVSDIGSEIGKGAEQAADAVQAAGGAVWDTLASTTGGTVITWRDKSGGALAALFSGVSGWSGSLGEGLDAALTYRTGEMTWGGSFACKECGTTMNLKKPAHLPPCPKCHKTAFRRA